MASRRQRVTNAQRAAVCALIIAGQPFVKSCKVVGAPYRSVQAVTGEDWWDNRGLPRRWKGDELRDLEAAYRDPKLPLATIAEVFKTSRREIQYLVKQHDWPRRQQGKGPKLPVSYTKMPPEQLNRYRKLRRIIGRSAAEQAVFGTAR